MVEYAYLGKGKIKHPLVWSCVITMLTMTLSVVYNFGFFTPRAVALTILFLFITVMLFGGTPGQKFTACLINGTMCLLVENSMRYVISWILKCELQQVIQRADCLIIIAVANLVVGAAVAFLVSKWRRRNALEPLQALTMSFFPGVVVVLNILLMLTDNNKRATMATMGMTVGLTVAVMVHLCIVAMFNDQVMQRRSLHFQAELEQQRASALLDSYTAQRRLTHEFTNHISALRALLEQGDVGGAQDYIAGVDKAVAASTTIMDSQACGLGCFTFSWEGRRGKPQLPRWFSTETVARRVGFLLTGRYDDLIDKKDCYTGQNPCRAVLFGAKEN